jgi:hypothetical protein
MQAHIKNNLSCQLEILLQESNTENSISGLEFIVDELYEQTKISKAQTSEKTTLDWFGLSDLCI